MPRVFNSEAEMLAGIQGYKGRNAYATAKREARTAMANHPDTLARAAHLRHANEDHALRGVIVAAEDRLVMLRARLAAAQRQADHMAENAYRSGFIHEDAGKVRRQLDGLPGLIERAENELVAARDALAAHRAPVVEVVEVEDVEPQAEPIEPVDTPKRAPGRPRKVTT